MPHSGSLDVPPITANDSPAIVVDVAEAAPAPDISINADPQLDRATVAAPVAEDDVAISVIAESPPAAQTEIGISDDSSPETQAETKPAVMEEASVRSVDLETGPVEVPELPVNNAPVAELPANVASVDTEEASVQPVDVDHEPVDIPEPVLSVSPSGELSTGVEPAVAEHTSASSIAAETAPVDAVDLIISPEPSSGVLSDVEPAIVDDASVAFAGIEVAATAVATESSPADIPDVVTDITPEPILASAAPGSRSAPKARSRVVEPADRAALIRQRWAETGIRMWNPRLHGTGDATLNIQGRIELLPPAPGETMPRYDKLEFRMLGGQIVCEGVIVEAPAQAGHRSFTRLAEPAKPDPARVPAWERQAALA